MITATPARKPVMIGAERKSAIQPRRSSPMRATITPTITARIPTRST
jgi:ABC-type iron transport system FetAB permease component